VSKVAGRKYLGPSYRWRWVALLLAHRACPEHFTWEFEVSRES
jgi:hypothetical protein